MSKLEKLKEHIQRLSPEELTQFRAWFAAFQARALDAQIDADAMTGELDSLISEALAEQYVGTTESASDSENSFAQSHGEEPEPRLSVDEADDAETIMAEAALEELARRHG